MITEYISGALKRARYEKIEDRDPYYGEIPGLKGVWATGKTLSSCRRNLSEALDGWIIVRLRKSLPLPKINGISLMAESDGINQASKSLLLTAAKKSEIDRRLTAYCKDPSAGSPWGVVRRRLRKSL